MTDQELAAADPRGVMQLAIWTETSLTLPPDLPFEAWQEFGSVLGRIASSHQWWVGDWWNYGERAYGEMASQASDLGIEPGTLSNWTAIASRVGLPLRNGNLPWSHHVAVAYLPPDEQERWLAEAAPAAGETEPRLTVSELRRRIAENRHASLPAIEPPTGQYRAIVIDPPWPMEKIEREVRPNQGPMLDYPTMSLEAIEKLPVGGLAYPDGCHVYLWVTHRFLPDGLRLFDAWGVRYQCTMTWVKNVGITPYSWMYDTEHVLFGRVGSLQLDQLGLRLSFSAPVTRHSAKPDVFYERVVAASPGPRLEMFARTAREGFKPWGNEVAA